jgi:hypothetical protein
MRLDTLQARLLTGLLPRLVPRLLKGLRAVIITLAGMRRWARQNHDCFCCVVHIALDLEAYRFRKP